MSDGFIDADLLAEALSGALSGSGTFDALPAAHEAARNARVRAMYLRDRTVAGLATDS